MTLTTIKTKNLMKKSDLRDELLNSGNEIIESGIDMLQELDESLTIQNGTENKSKVI